MVLIAKLCVTYAILLQIPNETELTYQATRGTEDHQQTSNLSRVRVSPLVWGCLLLVNTFSSSGLQSSSPSPELAAVRTRLLLG